MRRGRRTTLLPFLVAVGIWAFTSGAGAESCHTGCPETTTSVLAQVPTDTADTPDDDLEDEDDEDVQPLPDDDSTDDGATAQGGTTTQDGTTTQGTTGAQEDEDLPNTGAPVWLFGALGLGLLNTGGGLLYAENRMRPRYYWESHTG